MIFLWQMIRSPFLFPFRQTTLSHPDFIELALSIAINIEGHNEHLTAGRPCCSLRSCMQILPFYSQFELIGNRHCSWFSQWQVLFFSVRFGRLSPRDSKWKSFHNQTFLRTSQRGNLYWFQQWLDKWGLGSAPINEVFIISPFPSFHSKSHVDSLVLFFFLGLVRLCWFFVPHNEPGEPKRHTCILFLLGSTLVKKKKSFVCILSEIFSMPRLTCEWMRRPFPFKRSHFNAAPARNP